MQPSETLVLIYQITSDHISGNSNHSTDHHENLKSYNHTYFSIKRTDVHPLKMVISTEMWRIARQRLAKHIPKYYAVNKNRRPLLDNGFGYHGITGVSSTTQTWTAVLEPLKVVILIWFSQSYKSSEFKGKRNPEIQISRDERTVQDSDNRFIKQKEFNMWADITKQQTPGL
jgi:hypothetical protein